MGEILDVTLLVAGVFERLGVPYLVGGSLASSLHGIPRATLDADVVARLELPHVAHVVAALEDAFYLDEGAVRDAIERRASFNLIHLESLFKVDAHKLSWFRPGDGVSERQWADAVGVLEVAGERLDFGYLRRIAELRGVEELLHRACEDAGLSPDTGSDGEGDGDP